MDKINPVERVTFQEQSYQKLRQALMKGRFMPGDAVSLRGLASELGTSPMPIREAVRHLLAERALETQPNRTIIVPVMTRSKLDELRRLRVLLEGAIAEEGSRRVSSADLRQLHVLEEEMKAALARGDSKRYLTKNQQFHFILYRSADMGYALGIIETLWLQIGPSFNLLFLHQPSAPRDSESYPFLTRHHDAVLRALDNRDPRSVRAAIENDINDGMQFLIEQV